MDLIVAWALYPLVLAGLTFGCGLGLDRVLRLDLPLALVAPAGLAVIIVVGQFLCVADATAELTTPVIVAIAIGGLVAGRGRLRRAHRSLASVAAAAVFCVYAAPIVLSGEPTIAGYIRLDDTATWLALTDRLLEHGRDLSGLAPSSYEATLHFNLADGYPVGAFVPLGVAARLVPADLAWLVQPYMAFVAALLALGLWALAAPLVRSTALRAAAAFVGAQAALLFGYYLWGGVKEMLAAALLVALAALVAWALDRPGTPRAAVPALIATAALVGVLSAGGLIWSAVPLAGGAVLLAGRLGARRVALRSLGALAAVAVMSLPVIATGSLLPPTSSPLTDGDARGNLVQELDPAQAAGIWPSGDFRFPPEAEVATFVLIAVALAAACGGVAWAVRDRRPGPVLYVAGALSAAALLVLVGSPWVGGKALATASPAIPFAALLAVAFLAGTGRTPVAAAIGLTVAGGVVWSNALGYGGANLAPRPELVELERIGEEIAGEGPTLMTEYSPYGVRHFLRDADPESISELRRHVVPLTDGSTVPKGDSADTDEIEPAALAFYRTLVLRRSPAQSRPPSAYRLAWSGAGYEVWQRPAEASTPPERLALGDSVQPFALPDCAAVRELARGGNLTAAAGVPPIVLDLAAARYPADWATPETRDAPVPRTPGTLRVPFELSSAGSYGVWIGGSLRPRAELYVDGQRVGSVRHELRNGGGYIELGAIELAAGRHVVELSVAGADAHPGSAGDAGPLGPLVLSSQDAADRDLVTVPAAAAETLCGRRWDWIEVNR